MQVVRDWIRKRPATTGLAVFFVSWYVIQLAVLHAFGTGTARWLFFTELPERLTLTTIVTPGLLLSPLSHDMTTLTHIGGNIGFLLVVGGVSEPYIETWKIPGLVVGGGYVGMVVTMLTAPILQFWPLAGASTGITILWGYTGLRMADKFGLVTAPSLNKAEKTVIWPLVFGIPIILLYEARLNGNMSHLIGIVLGVLYFYMEDTSRLHRPHIS